MFPKKKPEHIFEGEKDISFYTNIYIRVKERSEEVVNPIYILPRIGELFQYNGVRYRINEVVHHNKEGFKPYIELLCDELE